MNPSGNRREQLLKAAPTVQNATPSASASDMGSYMEYVERVAALRESVENTLGILRRN